MLFSVSRTRRLEPIDRVLEVLFGLIMVLTFTGSLSIAEAGRDDVRAMLIGALGCNLAWGIIDAILYLMGCLAERGGNLAVFQAVREAGNSPGARRLIADALPPVVADILQPAELETMRLRLTALPAPPPRARLHKDDWLGAAGVFLLVFLSTFPVAVPFMLIGNAETACASPTSSPSSCCSWRDTRSDGSAGTTHGGWGARWSYSGPFSSASRSYWEADRHAHGRFDHLDAGHDRRNGRGPNINTVLGGDWLVS